MRRVLLVEDDDADALMMRRALNGGYQVEQARNLGAALALAAAGGWSAVVTDLRLPDVPDEEYASVVSRLVEAVGPDVPVLALSGALAPGMRVALAQAGAAWVGLKDGEQFAEAAAAVAAEIHSAEVVNSRIREASDRAAQGARAELADRIDALSVAVHCATAEASAARLEVSGVLQEMLAEMRRPRGIGAVARWLVEGWASLSPRARGALGASLVTLAASAPAWLRWVVPLLQVIAGETEVPDVAPMVEVVAEP